MLRASASGKLGSRLPYEAQHRGELMSAREIITALPKLSRDELEQVDAQLHQLLKGGHGKSTKKWGEALRELVGTAEGLPADLAQNHDHYLHGTPRQ